MGDSGFPTETPGHGQPLGAAGHDVVVARQPICDRRLDVVGYELLYRDPSGDRAAVLDPERFTASLIVNAFAEIGLDTLVGDRMAYVNVSRDFLLGVHPLPLRPDRVVLELPGDTLVDDALMAVIDRLVLQGFTLAIEDPPLEAEGGPLVAAAGMLKIDVLHATPESLTAQVERLRRHPVTLVAERVETREQFELCERLGFHLFQGYAFAKPEIVKGRGLPTWQLGAVGTGDGGYDELAAAIVQDVGLSWKLLRYTSSAFYTLPRRVSSIQDALELLGEGTVTRWAKVMALAGAEDRAFPVVGTVLRRAKMCELLGGEVEPERRQSLFTIGLLSTIDALLDVPIHEAVATLPFTDEVLRALLRFEGAYGHILRCVLAHERGEAVPIGPMPIDEAALAAAHDRATSWSRELSVA